MFEIMIYDEDELKISNLIQNIHKKHTYKSAKTHRTHFHKVCFVFFIIIIIIIIITSPIINKNGTAINFSLQMVYIHNIHK